MSDGTYILNAAKIAMNGNSLGKRVAVSLGDNPEFVAGRRSWIKYRELGVTEATAGAMRAQVIHAGNSNQNTGWHLHRCDMQFLYVMAGAINIAFHPDMIVRLRARDSIIIPGGTIHMELGAPEGVEVLEISVPADMSTENVDSPWGDAQIDFSAVTERAGVA